MIETHTPRRVDGSQFSCLEQDGRRNASAGHKRMASKAEDGVVNEHLAVHGMANLFVVSSSVLFTSSQTNPTFTVIVLALRLPDRPKLSLGGQ